MSLESLGLNTGLIVAMNVIIEALKRWDASHGEKLKKVLVFFPILFAFPVALLVTDWEKSGAAFTQTYLVNVILYAALSGYAYKLFQGAAALMTAKSAPAAASKPEVPVDAGPGKG